nr:hypothetical protein [Nitrosomonas nitrosa]
MEEDCETTIVRSSTLRQLKILGVLDEKNEITPEAYVGHIVRLPVNRQAESLGLPLILLPPPSGDESPESKVILFFKKDKDIVVDGGFEESYLVKSFITSITQTFDSRRRKHILTPEEIEIVSKKVHSLTDWDVLRLIEENNVAFQPHFGWSHTIKMSTQVEDGVIDLPLLKRRFKLASCVKLPQPAINDLLGDEHRCNEYLKDPARASQYAENMIRYLWLWRALSKDEWENLIRVVLSNWERMSTGWPDLNLISPAYGLLMVEVKGKDKLHNSQIYTLLRLREVLGPQRIAIAWANAISRDLPFDNRQHQASVWSWIRSGSARQTVQIENWSQFYNPNRALIQ